MELATLAIKILTGDVTKGVNELNKLTQAGARAERSTDGLKTSTERLSASMSSLGRVTGITVSIAAVGMMGKALYEAAAQAERLRMSLDFSFAGNGARELAYVSRLANELGLNAISAAQAYGKLSAAARGTTLAGEGARNIFEAVSKASVVMGLSTEQTEGALRALEQMISKGTVQSEELRGQLGERIPGAFQIAARAMGVTTQELGKMLELGQVVSEDFLPKFANQLHKELGDAATTAADRLDAATNRMANAWKRLNVAIGESGISQGLGKMSQMATNDMNALAEAMERAKANGGGLPRQLNDALAMGLGRTLGLQHVIDDFKTLDSQIDSTIRKIQELTANAEKQQAANGFISLPTRSSLAGANQRLANLTAERQRRDQASDINPRDRSLAETGKERERQFKEEEQRRAKRVEFLKQYATDEERVNAKIAESRKLLGDQFTTEDEKRIRASLGKKKKAADPYSDELKGLRERNALLGQETELERVSEMIKLGKFGKVSAAQSAELKAEAVIYDAKKSSLELDKEAKRATEEFADQRARDAMAQQSSLSAMMAGNEELELSISLMGADESATTALAIARLRLARARAEEKLEAIAAFDAQGDEVNRLKEEIRLLKEREDLTQRRADKAEDIGRQKKAEDEAKKIAENFRENVQRNLGDGIYDGMTGKFDDIEDRFKNLVLRMAADAAAANITKNMFTGGSTGMGWLGTGMQLLGMLGSSAGPSSVVDGAPWTSGFDIGPGKAGGGSVMPFGLQEVNERGPELLSSGGKDYLMMGSKGGHVTPNSQIGGKQIQITLAPVINIDSRSDRAAIRSDIAKAMQMTKAQMADEMGRAE